MVSKTMVKWVGVAAVMVMAACSGATGPMSECVMGDDNIVSCATPQPEPADAGVEAIAY